MTEERALVIAEATDADEFVRIAREHGLSVERLSARAEPVTTVTLLLLGSSVALAAAVAVIERTKGGQVIDLRPGAPKSMYRSRDVVYGLVVILAVDGTVQVEVHEPRGMFGEVVTALAGIISDVGTASVQAIARSVETKVGDRGEVTIHHAESAIGDGKALPMDNDTKA